MNYCSVRNNSTTHTSAFLPLHASIFLPTDSQYKFAASFPAGHHTEELTHTMVLNVISRTEERQDKGWVSATFR